MWAAHKSMGLRGEPRFARNVENGRSIVQGLSTLLVSLKGKGFLKKLDFVFKSQEKIATPSLDLHKSWSELTLTSFHRSWCTLKRISQIGKPAGFLLYFFFFFFKLSFFSLAILSFLISLLLDLTFFPLSFGFLPPHSQHLMLVDKLFRIYEEHR